MHTYFPIGSNSTTELPAGFPSLDRVVAAAAADGWLASTPDRLIAEGGQGVPPCACLCRLHEVHEVHDFLLWVLFGLSFVAGGETHADHADHAGSWAYETL